MLAINEQSTWDELRKLAPGGDLSRLTAAHIAQSDTLKISDEPAKTGLTSGSGNLRLEVPIGVYVVKEDTSTLTPENSGLSAEEISSLRGAEDFVVFVPTTSVKGDKWDYTVTVYPKNTSNTVVKSVNDAGKNVGDVITYTIEATVPAPSANHTRTKFEIVDNYDETKLDADSLKNLKVTVNDEDATSAHPYAQNNDTSSGTLKVTFNNPQDLPNNAKVKVSFDIALSNIGKIVNTAQSIDNDSNPATEENTTPSNEVVTYEGKVRVLKQGDSGQSLSGAVFELYVCTADGDGTYTLTGEPIEKLTTDAEGTATTKGLHVTDLQNSAESISNHYCLKETAAPAGYITPTGDAAITSFQLAVADLGSDFTTIKALPAIENVPSDSPDLPLTGGQGIALLVLLGAGIAGAAVYTARRNSVKA